MNIFHRTILHSYLTNSPRKNMATIFGIQNDASSPTCLQDKKHKKEDVIFFFLVLNLLTDIYG